MMSETGSFMVNGAVRSAPYLRVRDQAGHTLQEVVLTRDPVTLGRAADNLIPLKNEIVSRHHARLDWDGQSAGVSVTDLGSDNGTFIGEMRLPANTVRLWNGDQRLRIDPFTLELVVPTVQPPGREVALANPANPPSPASRFSIGLPSKTLALIPGTPSPYSITIRNTGRLVDHVRIEIEGVLLQVNGGQHVQLNPDRQETVIVQVTAPRAPQPRAGTYAVVVRVWSETFAGEGAATPAEWTVLPFNATQLSLTPASVRARSHGTYTINLQNNGNTTANYTLSPSADPAGLKFAIEPATYSMQINASQAVKARLHAHAPVRMLGAAQPQAVVLRASTPQGEVVEARAQFVHRAVLAPWLPRVVVPLLVMMAALVYFLWPTLELELREPAQPVQGEPFKVCWKASWTSQVEMVPGGARVMGTPLPNSALAESHECAVFAQGLSASNPHSLVAVGLVPPMRSRAVALPQAATPSPTPLPTASPTAEPGVPTLDVFEPDALQVTINQGQTVRIHWQFSNADSVEFDNNTVNASDERSVAPNQTHTYLLVATNKANKKFSRSLEIIVAPPTATPVPTPTPLPAPIQSAAQLRGGVDLNRFCNGSAEWHSSDLQWYCADNPAPILNAACIQKYGAGAFAKSENPQDKNSWACWL